MGNREALDKMIDGFEAQGYGRIDVYVSSCARDILREEIREDFPVVVSALDGHRSETYRGHAVVVTSNPECEVYVIGWGPD